MIAWSRKMTLGLGLGLIIVTNTIALVGVAYNRSGEPESTLRLTERELQLPYWSWLEGENTGIGLHVRYRVQSTDRSDEEHSYTYYYSSAPSWLNKEKLTALGFDVSTSIDTPEGRRFYGRLMDKEVLLVMEYDGPAYAATVENARRRFHRETELAARNKGAEFQKRRQDAERNLDSERNARSRLFIVDAALDRNALRSRYPDRNRYAIVSGRIKPFLESSKGVTTLTGRIAGLNVDTIQVPHDFRKVFEPLLASNQRHRNEAEPRYEATISYGVRLEPWIEDAALSRPN